MKVSWKHLYCYVKKLLGFKVDDDWDNNPFVVL
jgi:hypothetical protein